jgi:hypothetical protein
MKLSDECSCTEVDEVPVEERGEMRWKSIFLATLFSVLSDR